MVLVTGATGLVGSHLVYSLLKSGKSVRAIKRQNSTTQQVEKVFSYYSDNSKDLFKKIDWVDADLMDVYSLLSAMDGIDQVYHCAAKVSFEKKYEREMMQTNVEGTVNMVNAALTKGIKKFCHVSSIATLGKDKHTPLITEEMYWKTAPENSNYSISKYLGEMEVWRAAEEGLPVIVVNPSVIVGGGNWNQSSSNMFSKAHKGIRFYTEGATGFVDVRDVAALMIQLMESNILNQRFILNAENSTYRNYFDVLHTAFGRPKPSIKAGKLLSDFACTAETIKYFFTGAAPLITKETARSAHRKSRFSNKKILDAFPTFKFIPLETSIQDTAELYLSDLRKEPNKGFKDS